MRIFSREAPSAQVIDLLLSLIEALESNRMAADAPNLEKLQSQLDRHILEARQWLHSLIRPEFDRQVRSDAARLSRTWEDPEWVEWGEEYLNHLTLETVLDMARNNALRPEWAFEAWVERTHGRAARGE